jgi:DNA polymerase-3 subunit delta
MAALKAGEVEAFLRAPDPAVRFFLVYGPDTGLVSERAETLAAKRLGAAAKDPFALIRFEADEIASDPARLLDELHTVALFGGDRLVRLRAGSRPPVAAIEAALTGPTPEATLVVEAGALKGGAPLRKLFEGVRAALALPCYPDDARDLARIIDEELRPAGLEITPDARKLLIACLGGDRLASRQEVRKLALFCHGRDLVDEDAVQAITGDVSAQAIDALTDAVGLGDPSATARTFQRLVAEGTHASVIAGAAQRHLAQLQLARAEIDRGRTAFDAIRTLVPPVFAKRQAPFERQLVLWTVEKAERAGALIQDAILDGRRHPSLADAVIERALLAAASAARRR